MKFVLRIGFLLFFTFLSRQGTSQVTTSNDVNIGHRKEVVLKTRMKKLSKHEVVLKGYYQEVVGFTTHSENPTPIYGKKKRFRRVESTIRDREFRRKFGI